MTQAKFPHTFLSYMRVNFHREVSLTLFYFFFGFPVEYLDLSCHFCYKLLWVIVPKTEQKLKRIVVKIEHFTAVFLYPKERKEAAEMVNRNRTNPVQFYLSDDEQYILNTKFKASGMKSMSAFLRKLILYGYVYDVDYSCKPCKIDSFQQHCFLKNLCHILLSDMMTKNPRLLLHIFSKYVFQESRC